MIQNDSPHDAAAHHAEAPAAPVSAAAAVETKESSPEANARAPVKATLVDASSAAGAVVVPAKAVQIRSSKASSLTSEDSSVYQDTELVFDFGTYVGNVDPITGLRHGHGKLTYNNGNVYDGEWKQGAPDGIGEKRYKNGDVYRGGWHQGERQGRGGYLFAAGHYFEGMYKSDVASGYGILTTVNGDRYAGHWKDGKKDGKGRETLGDGQTFIGHWKDGKKQGRGKLLLSGAAGALYGIWHQDHFFRELTEEEMGVDGAEDIVDQFGLPREGSEDALTTRAAGAPAADGRFDLQSISERLQQQWMTGVNAMEHRLDALSQALEKVTTGGADGDADDVVNRPATVVDMAARRASADPASATQAGPRRAAQAPVTAAVAGTVDDTGDEAGLESINATDADAFASEHGDDAAAVSESPAGLRGENDGSAHVLSTAQSEEAE